ncbi:MAG: cation:proton antiporter [Proteobacteria bacterium]|jgi:Kef-type K+ transport system membrane component KefB|nr:cation:proton antiporter [Pseudomonadota bacterium]
MKLGNELQYLILIVGLFLVPRILQRFRIPSAITCVALGAGLGMGFHLFATDETVPILSTLGIVSLFLFAGLEVDLGELRRNARVVVGNLAIHAAVLGAGAVVFSFVFALEWRAALLFSLAVFTSSTGFILDSLGGFGLDAGQRYWVKTKAISTEIVSLVLLFFAVQSGEVLSFGVSTAVLAAMVLLLPLIFKVFVAKVLPFAPKSEFAFLLIMAIVCAYVTRELGVYYLVGAFVVGITAVRLRQKLPAVASERLIVGVELFASFFIPFYFFKAGLHFEKEQFGPGSIGIGVALAAVTVPLRIGIVAVFRRFALSEPLRQGAKVGLSLVPTLVFTIVIGGILKEEHGLSNRMYGALIVFALLNTILPGLLLGKAAPEFDAPHVPREGEP